MNSIDDMILIAPSEISRRAGISEAEALQLVAAASKAVYNLKSSSALDVLAGRSSLPNMWLSTGCPV
jgi:hypothetical protein